MGTSAFADVRSNSVLNLTKASLRSGLRRLTLLRWADCSGWAEFVVFEIVIDGLSASGWLDRIGFTGGPNWRFDRTAQARETHSTSCGALNRASSSPTGLESERAPLPPTGVKPGLAGDC